MKTSIKLLSLCALFIFACTSSCAQKSESKNKKPDRVTNISFNNFSNSPSLGNGFWTASLEDDRVYLQILNSRRNDHGTFMISFSVAETEFKKTSNGFELDRETGVMKFEGQFPTDEETGKFTFTRKSDFETFLKGKILSNVEGDKDYYFFKLFLGDVTRSYVNELQRMGYKPTMKQLGKLGIHNVDLDYINDVRTTKYSNLDLDMMIKWAIHDVSIEYVEQLAKAGYGDMDANMVKKFAIHNVTIDYIKGLAKVGYGNMDANMVKKFAIHSISLTYIDELSKAGYGDLDPNTLKNFAVHSIRPNYIKDLLSTNISKPDANTIKKAKIHNVTANFIKRARSKGHDSNDLYDYVKLKIRGI